MKTVLLANQVPSDWMVSYILGEEIPTQGIEVYDMLYPVESGPIEII